MEFTYNYHVISHLLDDFSLNKNSVELFGKPDLSPTFFEKVHWKNFTKPFIDGIYSDYLFNSIIVATSNAALVTVLALMATYALSRFKLPGSESIFFGL